MGQRDMAELEKLEEMYKNRNLLLRNGETGEKIIGYLCNFAPPELISAAGMIPYRITGKRGEIIEADDCVEPLGCPYIRNCFEQDLKGEMDFLDGRVISHSCDAAQRIYGIWNTYKKKQYSYLFNAPHGTSEWSRNFFKRELLFFKESLERFVGHKISEADIIDTIELYNQNRRLIKYLYSLRKEDPPRVTGSEILKILLTGCSIPPENFNVFLKKVMSEIAERKQSQEKSPRLMFWGCIIDDTNLFEMIEDMGAHIVIDDTCIGSKTCLFNIDTSGGVWEGLTKAYFDAFMCPRTDRGPGLNRFNYVLDLIREYNANGVIGYMLNFCDPHKMDYPDLRDYLDEQGIPMLLIHDNYSLGNIEGVRTRIEGFIEMLSHA